MAHVPFDALPVQKTQSTGFTARQSARLNRMFQMPKPVVTRDYVRQVEQTGILRTANQRGQLYLEQAQAARDRGDLQGAMRLALEGQRLSAYGAGYLSVREQLSDLIESLENMDQMNSFMEDMG